MNHPTREEWMSYLHGETKAGERRKLSSHLHACADCQAQVKEWRAARRALDAWQLRPRETASAARPSRNVFALPSFKWAAAAAAVLIVAAGFGAGRFSAPAADVGKIRAAIEPEIRQQLRQEFAQLLRDELNRTASATLTASGEQAQMLLADYDAELDARRAEDSQAIYSALDKLESQRVADYVSLKKDVDTVAVLTDAGLRSTEQQLVQLADYTRPAVSPDSPRN